MSKSKSIQKRPSLVGVVALGAGMVLLSAAMITVNVLTMVNFDNVLEQYFGATSATTRGDTHGADVEYVKSDYASAKDLYRYEEKLCEKIAQDGATLLKNDGLLPLAGGTKIDLFGVSSVNLVSGGSGSGSGSFELTVDLKTGLENAGFSVNESLWNFYRTGAGSRYQRGAGVVNYGRGYDWAINECPLSELQKDSALINNLDADNVAMFVVSRTGGEGGDEPRDMKESGGSAGEHYLELNREEREILQFLNQKYHSVIVLVNSNNAFELGFLHDSALSNVKAAINFPGAGRTGTNGLGYFLRGLDADGNEISPSGHLVDTFVYDNFSSPAMQNFGDAAFTDDQGRVIMYWGGDVMYSDGQYGPNKNNVNEDAGRCPFYFVSYNEGVYVGYKYYETRYEDYVLGTGNTAGYDYASTVAYPFGFGSSYTDFEWDGFTCEVDMAQEEITVSLTVRNVGTKKGRDVVQVYYQSPYTSYDKTNCIEKPAVSLTGFAKTGVIAPGGSEQVSVKVGLDELRSYDDSGTGKYCLEAGDYYITAAPDAHTAVNNILREKCAGNAEALARICETSAVTGMSGVDSSKDLAHKFTLVNQKNYEGVNNLFSDATLIDRSQYLSRKDWSMMENDGLRAAEGQAEVFCPGEGKNPWGNTHIAACTEINGKQFRRKISSSLLQKLTSSDSLRPESEKADNTTAPKIRQAHKLDLVDLRGADYDDPRWEELVSQMNKTELAKLVAQCGYCSPMAASVNKPYVSDMDGPAGLNRVVGHGSLPIGDGLVAMTWVTEYMLACTWDAEYAHEMGKAIGEDGLHGGVVGWYGPAMNIHRTPFSGRNFEYYSEDAYLSGIMGKNQVNGAAQKGMYGFVKHFALNDQETHRDQNGLITFSNEQAMRELYFKPFEMTIRNNDVRISYNEEIREGNNVSYQRKEATVPACTAIMSSFNRIGATWAGGNYNLITKVLREEFGFKGFVLTDYDTGNYMVNNTDQMLEAGGDAKLNTIGVWNGLNSEEKGNANLRYAMQAAKNILYTVANSAAMNGYVHGVAYVPGFAYYKLIVIGIDVVLGGGIVVLGWLFGKKLYWRRKLQGVAANEEDSSAQ